MAANLEDLPLPYELPVIPDGWRYEPLGNLVEERGISYGVVQPGTESADGVPIVRVNNIRNGRIDTADMLKVGADVEARFQRSRLRGGEVLLTLVGTLGEVAVVPENLRGWNVARAVGVIPVRKDLGSHWISICLRSAFSQHCIRTWATTTVQATLNLRDVAKLPIPIPPRDTREAIAAVLGALDDKIELNRRMNATLEAMARALFQSWFVDFDPVRAKVSGRRPARLVESLADLFPSEFQESELGLIPKRWGYGKIIDIGSRVLEKVEDPAAWASEPLIDLSRMPQGSIALGAWGLGEELTTSVTRFRRRDTLFGAIRPYFHKVGLAPVSGVTNVSVFVIRARDPSDWAFLGTLCSLASTVAFATRVAKGTKMPVVGWQDFANYQVVLPPKELRQAFASCVGPLYEQIFNNIHQSRVLSNVRDSLLPKLLSGELRVPVAA